jgi:hypothetical protein
MSELYENGFRVKPLEKVSVEVLIKLWENFPNVKFEPNMAWLWSHDVIMCSMYADNFSVVGTGKNINEVAADIVSSVYRQKEMSNLEFFELQ